MKTTKSLKRTINKVKIGDFLVASVMIFNRKNS